MEEVSINNSSHVGLGARWGGQVWWICSYWLPLGFMVERHIVEQLVARGMEPVSVAVLTWQLIYCVNALFQSLVCMQGGSILTVVGRGEMRLSLVVLFTAALPECLWLTRLLVSPIREDCWTDTQLCLCYVTLSVMGCSCGVGGYNEAESHFAIYNCTWELLWQSPLLVCPILMRLYWHQVMALHSFCWWIACLVDQSTLLYLRKVLVWRILARDTELYQHVLELGLPHSSLEMHPKIK